MSAHGTEKEAPVFAGAALKKLEALYPRFPTKQACLLPALWIIMEERGWVSPQSMAEVAEILGDSKRVAAEHYVYALTDYGVLP